MAEIKATFTYAVSPEKVFEALTEEQHIKRWWTPDCSGELIVGGKARFEFNPYGDYCVMQVDKLEPSKLVEWQCIEGKMAQTDEWLGTIISFELHQTAEGTTMVFTHKGWKEESPCLEKCRKGWEHFLGGSLKAYLETGKGQPFKPEAQ